MSKGMEQKKESKKKPAKTQLEKRAEKSKRKSNETSSHPALPGLVVPTAACLGTPFFVVTPISLRRLLSRG